jgi:hypothetical protein
MRLRIILGGIALCVILGLTIIHAQTNKTYTCTWNYSGPIVDSWQYSIDGTLSTVTPTCTGTTSLSCIAPITMSQNVSHTVIVVATNAFGSSSSSPFIATPPATPSVVVIR